MSDSQRPCPLQVIEIVPAHPDSTDPVLSKKVVMKTNKDALDELQKNLTASGCDKVAVFAIMGVYRSGKSFLLEMMLRRMKFEGAKPSNPGAHPRPNRKGKNGKFFDKDAFFAQLSDDLDKDDKQEEWEKAEPQLPEWMSASTSQVGFKWAHGNNKSTEGMWMWSEPLVIERENDEGKTEKLAVILMDTQGAWDSETDEQLSAAIFGLTAALGSKLVYNIEKRLDSNLIDNLLCFVEVARSALRGTDDDKKTKTEGTEEPKKAFQTLEFLIRDFDFSECNAETDGYAEYCEEGRRHFEAHMNGPKVGKAPGQLRDLFEKIDLFCMANPGKNMRKEKWDGDFTGKVLTNNDKEEFVWLLDAYVTKTLSSIAPKKVFGEDMDVDNFQVNFEKLATSFQNASPVAMSITEALAFTNNLQAKTKGFKEYRDTMRKYIEGKRQGAKMTDLKSKHVEVRNAILAKFNKKATFGQDKEINAARKELCGDDDLIDQIEIQLTDKPPGQLKIPTEQHEKMSQIHREYYCYLLKENQEKLEKVLTAFAGIATIGVFLLIIDLASNWLCDWWLQPCVAMSKLLFFAYLSVFGYIGFHIYTLYKDQGYITTYMAGSKLVESVGWKGSNIFAKGQQLRKKPGEEGYKAGVTLKGALIEIAEDLEIDQLSAYLGLKPEVKVEPDDENENENEKLRNTRD